MEADMYRKVVLGLLLALSIGTEVFAAPHCSNISTVWTLNSTFVDGITGTRIYSDGATYVDGSRGVSASIKCGTDDAVLIVGGTRKVMFNFAGAFLGTSGSNPPDWTNVGAFASTPPGVNNCGGSPCNVLNIRNILNNGNVDRSSYYKLYTKLVSGFVAPDLQGYSLRMENPSTSDVATGPSDLTANSPYLNARVVVEHYPAASTQKEYWLVYPELPTPTQIPSAEVAVLFGKGATVNYGQFTMPFYFIIEAQ
jgi:hypothetical protein